MQNAVADNFKVAREAPPIGCDQKHFLDRITVRSGAALCDARPAREAYVAGA